MPFKLEISAAVNKAFVFWFTGKSRCRSRCHSKAAAQDAMLAEWGMDVEFDDNGNIVSVVE